MLSLPDVLLPEILSWSPDSATANALLNTCSPLHTLRLDPAAAALLLLRCSSKNHAAAVATCSCACSGGTAAVVQHTLRLLAERPAVTPAPNAGLTPHGANRDTAPLLLQAMLYVSASNGDATGIRALLSLPQPPDIDGAECRALMAALSREPPHLEALQALLEHGALRATYLHGGYSTAFNVATAKPARAVALPLLLQHVPPLLLAATLAAAFSGALRGESAEAVAILLPAMDAAGVVDGPGPIWPQRRCMNNSRLLKTATCRNPAVLQVVLDSYIPPIPWLDDALLRAAPYGHAPCARLLLQAGADPNAPDEEGSAPLLRALQRAYYDRIDEVHFGPAEEAQVHAMLIVLLQHGAVVTPALVNESTRLRLDSPLLQNAVDAVRAAYVTTP